MFSAIKEGWYAQDWEIARDELAAVLEYDQGVPRARAESLATAQTYNKYGPCPPAMLEIDRGVPQKRRA